MTCSKKSQFTLASLVCFSGFVTAQNLESQTLSEQQELELERIIVRGGLSATPLSEMATSISVLDAGAIQARQAQHIEALLNRASNVNFASGASRGRFIQIRGIGERSQFTDPINPSVGYLVDGINYSGLLAGASTFDIEQIEIFKGPNSARFGADGLAGMINVISQAPSAQTRVNTQFGIANYNSWNMGAAVGGQMSDAVNYRFSIHQNDSDGFIENTWLGRDDTNGIDELTARAKFNWQASEYLDIQTVLHFIDVDNGYDAFSLNRDRTTLSDQPGFDTQESNALGLTVNYQGWDWAKLSLQSSFMHADTAYGYDEDWSYVGIAPGWEYSSTDHYFRDREDSSFQAKFSNKTSMDNAWVVGFYYADKSESLDRQFFNFDLWQTAEFDSLTERTDSAIFAQYKHHISSQQWLTSSLRLGNQSLDYNDSKSIQKTIDHSDWGAELSYHQRTSDNTMLYLSLLRSYKMGGVNGQALGKIDDAGLEQFRQDLLDNAVFDAESLVGLEFGIKGGSQDGSLLIDFTTFYQKRDDIQYKNSIVRDQSFVDFYNNAANGTNYGVEVSLNYMMSDNLDTFLNIGYLNTDIRGITRQDGTTIDNREQAHAPKYHINAGLTWHLSDRVSWLIELDGKDEFYYSYSHDQQAENFVITHTSLDYTHDNWQFSVYARNLFDKLYANRGFYFGNDPRDEYAPHLYQQFGEPRRIGINFRYQY